MSESRCPKCKAIFDNAIHEGVCLDCGTLLIAKGASEMNTTKAEHSPLPWNTDNMMGRIIYSNEGERVAEARTYNAAFMCRACNNFEALLAALKAVSVECDGEPCFCGMAIGHPLIHEHGKKCKQAQEAIKQAERT